MEKRIIPTESLYQSRAKLMVRIIELQDLLLTNQLTRRDEIHANPSFVDTEEYNDLINEAIILKAQIEIINEAYEAVTKVLKGMHQED